jgi:hypothetical protein
MASEEGGSAVMSGYTKTERHHEAPKTVTARPAFSLLTATVKPAASQPPSGLWGLAAPASKEGSFGCRE